ncbi:chitin synthase [Holotrichia oblita]|uniref:Chitin synthase n=1 Tax=Holotrichia oblita TaxID=644536 RepID=A0ACB9T3R0_HOLOL|nr:chitin synthase [Holotrichia oblita]
MYEPFLIDQDLALNRRVDDGNIWNEEEHDEDDFVEDIDEIRAKPSDFATVHDDDRITRIYACATMWHETKEEMMEFLKSIFRMDEDQCARRTVREKIRF